MYMAGVLSSIPMYKNFVEAARINMFTPPRGKSMGHPLTSNPLKIYRQVIHKLTKNGNVNIHSPLSNLFENPSS